VLEIVTEPDLHSAVDVRAYAQALRAVLRYVGASSGDMEKGVMRIEPNISLRPEGTLTLGTRVEIKNLNSFRTLERATAFQIEQQAQILDAGGTVAQETLGWDETGQNTFSQRSKEEAHDYRYCPEPDLPPLVVEESWIAAVKADLPEMPWVKMERLARQYELSAADARVLAEDPAVANYFEECAATLKYTPAKTAANWLTGEVFGWMNQAGGEFSDVKVSPAGLAELLDLASGGTINLNTAKTVLGEMLATGEGAVEIVSKRGLEQVSDSSFISALVRHALEANPGELAKYKAGKETVANWFYGQVMREARGKANPAVVKKELERQLKEAGSM
jgi:aspartyl-tRNA(Asn)/glutamyl-tRNA(Gln) amidotransferase subunit B